jgi:hypothetical protein
MENKKDKGQEVVLSESNTNRFKQLSEQARAINAQLSEIASIILDAKEIDYKDKQVKLSDDFTKIIVE